MQTTAVFELANVTVSPVFLTAAFPAATLRAPSAFEETVKSCVSNEMNVQLKICFLSSSTETAAVDNPRFFSSICEKAQGDASSQAGR